MIKDKMDSKVINNMWTTLDTEGWITQGDRLPKGWRVRFKEVTTTYDEHRVYFLSPQMEMFGGKKAVLDYIASHPDLYTHDDYVKIKQWIKVWLEEKYTWYEEDILPPGWKVRSVVSSNQQFCEYFLTPSGDQLRGRRKAL